MRAPVATNPPVLANRGRAAVYALPALAVAVALLAAIGFAAQAPVAFLTRGGDAWTFQKPIAISVSPGRCDEVRVTSPLSTIALQPGSSEVVARVPLGPGDNLVAAECRNQGSAQGPAAHQHWFVRLADLPQARVQVSRTDADISLDATPTSLAPVHPVPIVAYGWRARAANPAPLAGLPSQASKLVLPVPARDGEYYVSLRVTDAANRSDESTAMFRVRAGKPEIVELAEHPAWVDDAVIYSLAPVFFGRGGFADVAARLDELAALGATTLLISPITASAPRDFGYALTDHFHIRDNLGGEPAFAAW